MPVARRTRATDLTTDARAKAFTLAESLIASVVLPIAVIAVSSALAVSSSQTNAMDVDARALSLARELLEQIAMCTFDPPAVGDMPGWVDGKIDKDAYDNISDFNGYTVPVSPPGSYGGELTMSARQNS